ncbi:MAG: DotA/TraY family protein [Alphaproteobacteria bacterium]|nr:DotA/TraY family protein [Alphaproteobacteria bacterium]
MQAVNTKNAIKYATLPRIVPRIKDLVNSSFSYVALLMAHVYFLVRLLPDWHPYLKKENMGRFGVHNVIYEAYRNLKFSIRTVDQVLVFFAILASVLVIILQIAIFFYTIIFPPAMAFTWFTTPTPTNDIAYTLLDRVFGVPGIFCTDNAGTAECTAFSIGNGFATVPIPASTGPAVIPLPFHSALHELLRFYSTALMSVAFLIFLYFIVVILFETTATGSPFGKRFKNVWVPIRLVMAVGLLLPLQFGLNSSQYLVLYAAKFGSSFATVGWNQFNAGITSHSLFNNGADPSRPIGEKHNLIALPEPPNIAPVIEAMSIVHACAFSYLYTHSGKINESIPNGKGPDNIADTSDDILYPTYAHNYTVAASETELRVQPYLVKQPSAGMVDGATIATDILTGAPAVVGNAASRLWLQSAGTASYLQALGFYYGQDIIIRFGEYALDDDGGGGTRARYREEVGEVKPLCGEIRIPVSGLRDPGGSVQAPPRGGSDHMLRHYYDGMMLMWFVDIEMRQFARSFVMHDMLDQESQLTVFCTSNETSGSVSLSGIGYAGLFASVADCQDPKKTVNLHWAQEKKNYYEGLLRSVILSAWNDFIVNSTYYDTNPVLTSYGWGGAGIWYSKLTEVNGEWMDSINELPHTRVYPLVMEEVRSHNKRTYQNISPLNEFNPSLPPPSAEEAPKELKLTQPKEIATTLSNFYDLFKGGIQEVDTQYRPISKNPVLDAINAILGTSGLMSMRNANAHLHPMVQLVAIGKGLVNSTVRNLAIATGAATAGGLLKMIEDVIPWGPVAAEAASSLFVSTAFLGLTAGIVLFYILPFLPFIYFYFAVISWIKAIFEAMVGAPLWALAHLRIDGEGLPGDSAQNGYFLILEIFIRPILTVFGFVAAIIIFTAQVRILNMIWDVVVTNLTGASVGMSDNSFDIAGIETDRDASNVRGVLDQFFFTVVYAIVCYMMALASFKLIDRIPDNILRWIGGSVSAFSDINQEEIDSINRYASIGGLTIGQQAAGSIVKLGGGLGGAVSKTTKEALS